MDTSLRDRWVFDRFEIRPARRQVWIDQRPVRVGSRAFDILIALMERHDRVVTKAELMNAVWPGRVVEENNIVVQIGELRKLLGDGVIATIPRIGYRFVQTVTGLTDAIDATPPIDEADIDRRRRALLPPEPDSPLIGRTEDLERLASLLRVRGVVTVCGPGGVGKTRLALRYVHGRPAGTTLWIDLQDAAGRSDVERAMANALGVTLTAGEQWAKALERAARPLPELVVLDCIDRVVEDAVAAVLPLVQRHPSLRLLATGQLPLGVHQEQVLRLRPLAVPDDVPASDEAALTHAGVALFVGHARSRGTHVTLDARGLAEIVDICRRLDGLPLALELAAARIGVLGTQVFRDGLRDGLHLLRGGTRDAPTRHRSLEAALHWAHALLAPEHQRVFRRLSVYPGRFSLDMAQGTVMQPGDVDLWEVIDAMGALAERSLLMVEDEGTMSYRLLNTARTFARDRLREAGE